MFKAIFRGLIYFLGLITFISLVCSACSDEEIQEAAIQAELLPYVEQIENN